jgi:hypothetical protein
MKRLLPLAALLFACRSPSVPRANVSSAPIVAAPSPPATIEGDYRGAFDGAELFASLDACSPEHEVHGSLFYARIGVPIEVAGTCSDTELTLHERRGKKDISTITLRFGGNGWDGVWHDDRRRGPAHIEALADVTIARRRTRVTPPNAECPIDVDVPTPLGLVDRAFQRRLREELEKSATTNLDAVYICEQPAIVTYKVHRAGRDFLGVVFTFAYNMGAPTWRSWALSVAIDRGVVAKHVDEIADAERTRDALRRVIDRSGWNPNMCVAWEDGTEDGSWNALAGAEGAAVSTRGLVVCRPVCVNHSHGYNCFDVPYSAIGLRGPFDTLVRARPSTARD